MDTMQDTSLQDDLCLTIAEHAAQCNSIFQRYMVVPKVVPDPTILDDQAARFRRWAADMEVFGPRNVSLDYRLRSSPTLLEIIHELLDSIRDILASSSTTVKPQDSAEENTTKITNLIGGTMTRLLRLATDVRKSANADRARQIEGHIWECRAPSHHPITFVQEIQYQEHAIKEHGVPRNHVGTLSGAARRPVSGRK